MHKANRFKVIATFLPVWIKTKKIEKKCSLSRKEEKARTAGWDG